MLARAGVFGVSLGWNIGLVDGLGSIRIARANDSDDVVRRPPVAFTGPVSIAVTKATWAVFGSYTPFTGIVASRFRSRFSIILSSMVMFKSRQL